MPGEFDLIEWIKSQHNASPFVPVPQGDDLAVLKWDSSDLLLVGVDQVLDGIHFDSAIHSPRAIGRKVMNRNLSDCAAMASLPAAAVASVALHAGCGLDYARELYLGLRAAAEPFDCVLVGGDTASWPGKLVVTVTIFGKSAGVKPITRTGAKPGDGIYITGPLGGSILGRHMTFAPRIAMGRALGESGAVTAMIDLSDGLSGDVHQISSASDVGAVIEADAIPIHPDARTLGQRDGHSGLYHALNDGEDHELLFTATRDPGLPGISRIGTIIRDKGVWLLEGGKRQPLLAQGWEYGL